MNILKITIMLFAIIFCSFGEVKSNENVPQKVLSSFEQKFPNAKKVVWEMEDETVWEAEFKMNGKAYSANFSKEGEWKETEHEIKKSEIPSEVLAQLSQKYAAFKIIKAEKTETPSGIGYEIDIKIGKEKFEVEIDSKGKLKENKVDEKD